MEEKQTTAVSHTGLGNTRISLHSGENSAFASFSPLCNEILVLLNPASLQEKYCNIVQYYLESLDIGTLYIHGAVGLHI